MVIRVTGTGGPRATSSPKKTEKTKGAGKGFASALSQSTGSEGATPTAPTDTVESAVPVSSVDALLSVQQVSDPADGRSKKQQAMDWGKDLLDLLDEIRHDLLIGNVPQEKLHQIAREISVKKQNINDPRLESVLNEIELRAAVELAKHARR